MNLDVNEEMMTLKKNENLFEKYSFCNNSYASVQLLFN